MAKLRMTYKNLKALRKSKEYQAMLVDLVASGVISKSKAEDLLGFNIPANLIGGTESSGTDNPIDDPETGGEGSGSGSGSGNTVTLLYYATPKGGPQWLTAEYDLTDDPTGAGILDFAKTEFGNNAINSKLPVELNPEYVEDEADLSTKYTALDPLPDSIEPGMLVWVYSYSGNM